MTFKAYRVTMQRIEALEKRQPLYTREYTELMQLYREAKAFERKHFTWK